MTSPANRWTRVAFGDVVRKLSDRVDPETSGLERYVAGEHMDTDDLRIRRWGMIGDGYLGPAFHMRFKPGQVLYGSRRTYLRKVAVPDFEGVTANTTFVLEPKDPAVLLPEFLPYVMSTESFHSYSIAQSKGSVNPYINFSDLAKYEFALPPLDEQHRIAGALMNIEAAMNSIDIAVARGVALWKAMSAAEFRKHSGTGEPLARHVTFSEGQVDPRIDGFADLPLVGPDHIAAGTGDMKVPPSAMEQGAVGGKYHFEPGTVLYSKIRPELQKAAIADFEGLSSADIYPLSPGPDLRPNYLLEILLSPSFTRFAVSGSRGSAIPRVNREHLKSYRFSVPSIREQDEYLDVVAGIRSAVSRLQERSRGLFLMKRGILFQVSNG